MPVRDRARALDVKPPGPRLGPAPMAARVSRPAAAATVTSRLPSPQVATTILAGSRRAPAAAAAAPPAKAVPMSGVGMARAQTPAPVAAGLALVSTGVKAVGSATALSLVPPRAGGGVMPAAPGAMRGMPEMMARGSAAPGPPVPETPMEAPAEAPDTAAPQDKAAPDGPAKEPAAMPAGDKGEGAADGKGGKETPGGEGKAGKDGGKEGEAPVKKKAPSAREAIAPAAGGVKQRAKGARAHSTSPSIPVGSAEAAALSPATEKERGAAAATVKGMDAADADKVRRDAFKTALQTAIQNATTPAPKTESAADRMMKKGASDASGALRGELTTQKDAAAKPMQDAAKTEVSPDTQPAVKASSLEPEPMGKAPAPVSGASVVPEPLPPEQLDYSEDRAPADNAMAEAGVTKDTLEKGNDPAFGPTLEARSTAEKHEAKAEATYRKQEANVQQKAHGKAQAELAEGLGDMHGVRGTQVGKVVEQQNATQTKKAAEHKRITDTITGIKTTTKALVDGILSVMDADAGRIFEDGLKDAESIYEQVFEDAKGGVGTWLTTWGDDWEELIEDSLATARQSYLRRVDQAIDAVADSVDAKLKAAKDCVTAGRTQVDTFVKGLDESVMAFGNEARDAVGADFDALETEIDSRRDALIDKLVTQYKASYERMEAKEQELREANKSLWQRVYDATVGLIKKILAFKDMLLSILAKAAGVISDIISDPIGFLGNLVDGVMLGMKNFMGNIASHLQKGLMEWLFGALAGAGLVLPDTFDLKGIVSIVLQVLGLTYANFRARAVAIVGEPVVAALEKTAEVFKVIVTEGIPGLWRFIKEKLADLKSMVLDAIFDFIKEKVIIAGVTWVIGLLNPASAFFKACKAIYDIVMFFINKGSQIIALVNAVVDSIAAIAKGSIGVAATMVENALAKAIPVAIGFLASLLGLGDISETIKKTIEKAQAPVNKAIDWVINGAVKVVKAAGNLVKGLVGGKEKPKPKEAPEHKEDLGDAKNAARDAVHTRLGASTSDQEAHDTIPVILNELRPLGLHDLILGPENEAGDREVLAEASIRKRIALLRKKKITVGVRVRVTVAGAPVDEGLLHGPRMMKTGRNSEEMFPAETLTFGSFGNDPDAKEALGTTGRAATLPPVSQPSKTPAKHGDQPSGGLVVEPEKGSTQLEILAWNTSAPERGHNVSHAERQAIDWLWSRPMPWKRRVQRIDIDVEGRAVCDICRPDLERFEEHFKAISKEPDKLQINWTGKPQPDSEPLEVT